MSTVLSKPSILALFKHIGNVLVPDC